MIEVKRVERPIRTEEGGREMNEKITDITTCAKEIAKVLEKHNVTIGDMGRVLDVARDLIMSSTPIHIA